MQFGLLHFFGSNKKYSWTTIFQTNHLLYFKYFFSLYFDELSDLIWGRSVNDMKTSLSPLSLLLSSFFPAFGKHPNRWQRLCLHLSCKLSLQEIEWNLSRQTSKSLTYVTDTEHIARKRERIMDPRSNKWGNGIKWLQNSQLYQRLSMISQCRQRTVMK